MPLKSDLLRLRDLCRTSLDLTFFGHRCTVWLIHEDLADALFFYRHHIRSDGALANTHVMLHAPGGFYRSLLAKDHAPKTMIGIPANKEDPLFHRVFQDWSGAPSVLPPFFTRTLQDRFTVTPGAVIAPAVGDGQTGWLLRGANYAGKSSLAMALIQRGFGLVSDHLVVRQNTDGTCMGYHSPIGLRRHNYHAFRAREDLDRISHRETISADTGPVALVHAEDLLDVKRLDSCKPGLELTLQRDPKCREITLHRSRPKPRRRAGPGHCAAARPNAPRRHSRHPHQSFRMTLTLSDTTDWTAKRADFARPEFSLAIVDNLLTAESARAICRDLHALPGWHQPDWGKNWFDLSSGYQQLINPDLPGIPAFCQSIIAAMDWPQSLRLKGLFAVRCNGNAGLLPHADNADYILNLWITPDCFNRQIGSGGMTVWGAKAPSTASPEEFTNAVWVQSYLDSLGDTRKMQIPYRCNRAIVFDAKLFHQSQPIDFSGDSPQALRTNVTFAFATRP